MKNRKIPGFPPPEDQDVIQFHFFRKLSYTARMIIYICLIIAGFVTQIITVSIWPGAVLLLLAVLINMVKGYDTSPQPGQEPDYSDNWARTTMERIHRINQIKEDINKWDKDALDISNGTGCLAFGIAAIVLAALFAVLMEESGMNVAAIFIVDAVILILSLWFNGLRIKGHQNDLYIKTDLIIELERHFRKVKREGEEFVPSLRLAVDKEGKEYPTDCRFNIVFTDAPADFYGILAQTNINVVESSHYPYFYCVITAKAGFGLKKYLVRDNMPKSIIMEYSDDEEAEVIVIRQRTTKSTGYHTKMNTCKSIMEFALNISRKIISR